MPGTQYSVPMHDASPPSPSSHLSLLQRYSLFHTFLPYLSPASLAILPTVSEVTASILRIWRNASAFHPQVRRVVWSPFPTESPLSELPSFSQFFRFLSFVGEGGYKAVLKVEGDHQIYAMSIMDLEALRSHGKIRPYALPEILWWSQSRKSSALFFYRCFVSIA